jgi:hypothetical protein
VGLFNLLGITFKSVERRRVAEHRAMDLLWASLSPTQRAQFNNTGRFEVAGSETGHRYIIRNITTINIDELDAQGRCVRKWCFVPVGDLAQGDVLLAQKVALECFEGDALAVARVYAPEGQILRQ